MFKEMLPTVEEFNRYCPVAKDPNNKVYVKCIPALEAAARRLQTELLGPVMPEALSEAAGNTLAHLVCVTALADMLPQLDLVMTPTGAGVVSNDNLAPASRERVEALARQLRRQADAQTDALIEHLRDMVVPDGDQTLAWAATEQAATAMPTFLYSGLHMQRYAGKPEATRSDAIEAMPAVETATLKLRHLVGDELIDHLLQLQRRRGVATALETIVTVNIRTCLGLALRDNHPAAHAAERLLLKNLETHLADFPLYANSSAYRANHTPAYENKKDSSSFFFS